MMNDSSLGGSATQSAFDIDSQKGVMALLASVRASELTPEQKNELRDLVFLYINGGKDQSVRISLQQKVSSYGLQQLKPVVAADPVPVQPASPFGASRPVPSFSFSTPVQAAPDSRPAPAPTPTSVPPPTPEPSPTVEPTPIAETPSVPPPQPVATSEPEVVSVSEPTSVPTPTSVPPPTPEPVVEVPVPPPPAPEPSPMVESAPVSEPISAGTPTPTAAFYDPAAAMQRIREIKALVNERVGNPVNLVDINNDVGREYMAALLDAMKKLNSGTSVTSAMKRLEDSFMAVLKTLDAYDERGPASELEPISVPPTSELQLAPEQESVLAPQPASETIREVPGTPIPEPASVSQPATESVREVPAAPEPESVPVTAPEPTSMPEPTPTPEPVLESVLAQEPRSNTDEESVKPWVDTIEAPAEDNLRPATSIPVRAVPAGVPAPIPHKKEEGELESAWGPATDTLQPVVVNGRVLSLAESDKKLRSLDDLPTADEILTSATGDPLFTKEVDDGLQQLLLEWPLFKKSGLFGTGPKGREHPLFKRLADLQIPLLLAGRFEGATQEIRQSITDYMNGWRYEQGIIYEQGETFERYLRRVIRHILDLQKKRHNS